MIERLYTLTVKGLVLEDLIHVQKAVEKAGWTPDVKQEGFLD